jgi:hypothetical protein
VGASGKGREGSSWDHVEAVLAAADPDFVAGRLVSGLSSGEGLIAEVRDPLDPSDTAAPADKRLLVLEPEFAQVMKVLAREGNTLSPVVRNGWDGKRLQALVRNLTAARQRRPRRDRHAPHQRRAAALPQRHRARQRLLQRFLLVAVRRSKLLPFGELEPPGLTGGREQRLAAAGCDRLDHQNQLIDQTSRQRLGRFERPPQTYTFLPVVRATP